MSKPKKDETREHRIMMEIMVDAYGAEEQAMGWYYYLEDTLNFPFTTKCVLKRVLSPLKVGDVVKIISMAPEEECQREMFVMIPWEKGGLAVPLMQLEVVHGDEGTCEAVRDWHYWVCCGYTFG